MTSYFDAVTEVLGARGAVGVFPLAEAARKLAPVRKDTFSLAHEIIKAAKRGQHGLRVAEYPSYRLRGSVPKTSPRGRYVRCALDAIAESARPLSLEELATIYRRRYGRGAIAPEFWMFTMLRNEARGLVTQLGDFRVGLKSHGVPYRKSTRVPPGSAGTKRNEGGALHQKISEENLEALLSERPEQIEPGLRLIKRQYATEDVGRIDLLCRDSKRNLVVVELKRFGASTESIIDQVTRYMGWVQEHLTKGRQSVRGYIVVGKVEKKLQYSVRAVRNLKVKCFNVSLTDPE